MSLDLALADAASNCARRGAQTTVTLRNGVRLTGRLQEDRLADLGTRHMHTSGGWITFLTDEVVAVESHR